MLLGLGVVVSARRFRFLLFDRLSRVGLSFGGLHRWGCSVTSLLIRKLYLTRNLLLILLFPYKFYFCEQYIYLEWLNHGVISTIFITLSL